MIGTQDPAMLEARAGARQPALLHGPQHVRTHAGRERARGKITPGSLQFDGPPLGPEVTRRR